MEIAKHLRHTWSVVGCRRTDLVSLGCATRRAYEKREAKRSKQRFAEALARLKSGVEPVFTAKARYGQSPVYPSDQSVRAE